MAVRRALESARAKVKFRTVGNQQLFIAVNRRVSAEISHFYSPLTRLEAAITEYDSELCSHPVDDSGVRGFLLT